MKKLSDAHQHELDKYIDVFNNGTTSTPGIYGHNNWGKGCYDYIQKIKPNSILDIGCGQGVFVNEMHKIFQIPHIYGLDIASIRTGKHIKNDDIIWLDSLAHDIPLPDSSIEYITSFDCLEHVLPEDVILIVNEFYRVCTKGLILRISYRQANERTFNDEVLHMTVQPKDWWISMFSQRFTFIDIFNNDYLIFSK
jgi:ubiquinone/menaquinone biosynthesis C-methylase UbiE